MNMNLEILFDHECRAPKKNYSGNCINKFIYFLDIHDVFDKTPLFFLGDGKPCRLFFQHAISKDWLG